MTDIFLSYSKHDADRARGFVHALEERGWLVFWDQRIPPGSSFSRYIQQKIDEATCVVVLWSKDSVDSEWVEIEAAWAKRNQKLIPALPASQIDNVLLFEIDQAKFQAIGQCRACPAR